MKTRRLKIKNWPMFSLKEIFFWKMISFVNFNMIQENKQPKITHNKNEQKASDKIITFFIKTASIAVKIRAKSLYWISFLLNNERLKPSFVVSNIKKLPANIKNMPKIEKGCGISFIKIIPKTSPTIAL